MRPVACHIIPNRNEHHSQDCSRSLAMAQIRGVNPYHQNNDRAFLAFSLLAIVPNHVPFSAKANHQKIIIDFESNESKMSFFLAKQKNGKKRRFCLDCVTCSAVFTGSQRAVFTRPHLSLFFFCHNNKSILLSRGKLPMAGPFVNISLRNSMQTCVMGSGGLIDAHQY